MSFDENFFSQSCDQCVIGFNDNDITFSYNNTVIDRITPRKGRNTRRTNNPPPIFTKDLDPHKLDNSDDSDSDDENFEDFFNDTDSNTTKKKSNKCPRADCNHQELKKREIYTVPHLDTIRDINDIVTLGNSFHCKKNKYYYGLDLEIMYKLIEPIEELNRMVGMENIKENIVNQLLFFLQDMNGKNKDMLHTVLTGPPGVGKTELGKILGKIYSAMGVLSSGHMNIVSRSDLIGKYLGHTAAKTQAAIDKASGGVLFIDEAYSLGNSEGRDSFSKECIDTINANLTERRDFLCIIAGYKDQLENCFFNYNAGLKRRFSFRYDISSYTPEQLKNIFELKIRNEGWDVETAVKIGDTTETVMQKHLANQQINNFFINNIEYFPYFGGDIETLLLNCKIQHSKRVMFLPKESKKMLNIDDIKNGFDAYLKNRQYKEDTETQNREKNSFMLY